MIDWYERILRSPDDEGGGDTAAGGEDTAAGADTTPGDTTPGDTAAGAQDTTPGADTLEGGANNDTSPETNWRDLITDPEARKEAERSTDPNAFAKRIVDLRKQLSKAIVKPDDNATDEQKAAWRKALDIPDDPKGYDVPKPEHIPEEQFNSEPVQERVGKFVEAMHEAGAPKAVVQKALDTYWQIEAEAQKALVEADKQFAEQSEAQLKKEWGSDFDRNKTAANKALAEFMGPDLEAFKQLQTNDGRFIGDHPLLVKAFAKMGLEMGEDRVSTMTDEAKDSLQEQIGDLEKKKFAAYDRRDMEEAERLDKKQAELLSQLHGDGPIVGAQGRTA